MSRQPRGKSLRNTCEECGKPRSDIHHKLCNKCWNMRHFKKSAMKYVKRSEIK